MTAATAAATLAAILTISPFLVQRDDLVNRSGICIALALGVPDYIWVATFLCRRYMMDTALSATKSISTVSDACATNVCHMQLIQCSLPSRRRLMSSIVRRLAQQAAQQIQPDVLLGQAFCWM